MGEKWRGRAVGEKKGDRRGEEWDERNQREGEGVQGFSIYASQLLPSRNLSITSPPSCCYLCFSHTFIVLRL